MKNIFIFSRSTVLVLGVLLLVPQMVLAAGEQICCANIGTSKNSVLIGDILTVDPSGGAAASQCEVKAFPSATKSKTLVPGYTWAKLIPPANAAKAKPCGTFYDDVKSLKSGEICQAFKGSCVTSAEATKVAAPNISWPADCPDSANTCVIPGTSYAQLTELAKGGGGAAGSGSGVGSGTPNTSMNLDGNTLINPLGGSGIDMEKPISSLAAKVINLLFGITGSVALAMFVYGGFRWLTSMGNPKGVEAGKQVFVWASLGLLVMFSSYVVVRYIFGNLLTNVTPGNMESQKITGFVAPKKAPATNSNTCKITGITGSTSVSCEKSVICKDASGACALFVGPGPGTSGLTCQPASVATASSLCGVTAGAQVDCYVCVSGVLQKQTKASNTDCTAALGLLSGTAGYTCEVISALSDGEAVNLCKEQYGESTNAIALTVGGKFMCTKPSSQPNQ